MVFVASPYHASDGPHRLTGNTLAISRTPRLIAITTLSTSAIHNAMQLF